MDIGEFMKSVKDIDWFSKRGIPSDKYYVVQSLFEAYDDWNDKYMKVWQPKTQHLEEAAQNTMGDKWIDECFSAVTSEIGDLLWSKWEQFIERQDLYEETGLDNEFLDMVIRDLSWAYIEQYLNEGDFFTSLLQIYRDGYFPCAWEDTYPEGKAVVI